MRALLDTHAFLWFVRGDQRLSARAQDVIEDADSELILSTASAWEIIIKAGIGRLKLEIDADLFLREQLATNQIEPLPIQLEHTLAIASLPSHHRDPFDRIIIAQGITERLPIITGDSEFSKYRVPLIW
ncbi:MAG TPA: type II toxin-antitoxin system VapC family toxin [Tepidisphaeraceae bacterium]|jgi:PIN domain nuclease of toxin-antitoxin system|nr:type II toxin-antitoxin system VapC family toxin [Tepidisphaeraceae bacterium]